MDLPVEILSSEEDQQLSPENEAAIVISSQDQTIIEYIVAEHSNCDDVEIDALIDNVTTIDDVKEVLKAFGQRLKRKLNGCEGGEQKKPKVKTNPIDKKVESIGEFTNLMAKASESQEFKEKLVILLHRYKTTDKNLYFYFLQVRYWKKLPGTGGMLTENGKLHAVLLSIFDMKFLSNNVLWGKLCVKKSAEQHQSNLVDDDIQSEKVYLKLNGTFLLMIKEVLDLNEDEPIKKIAEHFKNILSNKVKRDKKVNNNDSKKK